jgi:hypothetical protein
MSIVCLSSCGLKTVYLLTLLTELGLFDSRGEGRRERGCCYDILPVMRVYGKNHVKNNKKFKVGASLRSQAPDSDCHQFEENRS